MSKNEYRAYHALEIATSLVKLNSIEEDWSMSVFLGHKNFAAVMGRNLFKEIHGDLAFRPPSSPSESLKKTDPLWMGSLDQQKLQ